MEFAAPALAFFGGIVAISVLRQPLVALVVCLLSRQRFAQPQTLEGCTPALCAGAAAAGVVAFVVNPPHHVHAAPTLPGVVLAVLTTIAAVLVIAVAYSVVWLYVAASGVRGRQFDVVGGRIRRLKDDQALAPVWVERQDRFVQSDALHGSTLFTLIMHDSDTPLARNGYSSEESFRTERDAVLACSGCCAMDLVFVWRASPFEWLVARMDSRWASVLWPAVADADSARGADLAVWRRFLLPNMEPDARIEIDRAALAALVAALPPLPEPVSSERDRKFALREPAIAALIDRERRERELRLGTMLARIPEDGIVEAMTSARFDAELRAAARGSGGATFNAGQDSLRVRLTPRG